jgi:hypothetical protein
MGPGELCLRSAFSPEEALRPSNSGYHIARLDPRAFVRAGTPRIQLQITGRHVSWTSSMAAQRDISEKGGFFSVSCTISVGCRPSLSHIYGCPAAAIGRRFLPCVKKGFERRQLENATPLAVKIVPKASSSLSPPRTRTAAGSPSSRRPRRVRYDRVGGGRRKGARLGRFSGER